MYFIVCLFHTHFQRSYVNAISKAITQDPPPQLYGGIIADPMGLGKTLTMIALAATDLLNEKSFDSHYGSKKDDLKQIVDTTLIIVPPPRSCPPHPSPPLTQRQLCACSIRMTLA